MGELKMMIPLRLMMECPEYPVLYGIFNQRLQRDPLRICDIIRRKDLEYPKEICNFNNQWKWRAIRVTPTMKKKKKDHILREEIVMMIMQELMAERVHSWVRAIFQ